MSNPRTTIFAALAVVAILAIAAAPAAAKDGRVRIWTSTDQAHIFIDGRSMGPLVWQGRAYKLSAGEHEDSNNGQCGEDGGARVRHWFTPP